MNRFLRYACVQAALIFLCASPALTQSLRPIPALIEQHYQDGTAFNPSVLFTPTGTLDPEAARFAPASQFLQLDFSDLQLLQATAPRALALELYYRGQTLTVDLVQAPVFTDDFVLETSTSGAQRDVKLGLHYRGILRGDRESVAAFSFFDGDVMGLISTPDRGNLVLGKLETPGNTDGFILYEDAQLQQPNPFVCGAETVDVKLPEPNAAAPEVSGCVRVFFEIDYELFQNKLSVQNTLNYVGGAFNQLATLYANEAISTKLSQVFVWTNPDAYSTTSSSTVLNQFRTFRTSFNADLAHLVGIGGSNLGGIAYVNTLCSPTYSHAYSDINTSYSNVPTYSWTIEVLTHEMGHNLGSNHTQWCGWTGGALDNCVTPEGSCSSGPAPTNGGTIMSYCHLTSYGINFSNGFGPQPGNLIRSRVSSAGCLAASCASAGSCAPPTGLSVTNVSESGATIGWVSVSGATSYTLQWRIVGAATWNTVPNAASPYNLGGLPANDEIEVSVQTVCGTAASGYINGVVFKTGAGSGGTCGAPAGLTAQSTSSSSANVSWTLVSGASSYEVSWKLAVATTWGAPVSTTGTSYSIGSLSSNSSYNVRVRALCSGVYSNYASSTFTTPGSSGGGGACGIPGGLAASSILTTSAVLSWSAVSGAQSYDLQIKAFTSNSWFTFANLPVTSVQVTGLKANRTYRARVRAYCPSGGYSSYSSIIDFTTPVYLIGDDQMPAEDRNAPMQVWLGAEAQLSLWPNPVAERLNIQLEQAPDTDSALHIADLQGRLIETHVLPAGARQLQIDVERLPAGMYWIRVDSMGLTGRFVVE